MRSPLKTLGLLVLLIILGRIAWVWLPRGFEKIETAADEASKEVETTLSQTERIREELTVGNDARAIGQAIQMFRIDRGRPPRSLEELVKSGNFNGSTKDPFGQPYRFQTVDDKITITSGGRDRIMDTEDDLKTTHAIR